MLQVEYWFLLPRDVLRSNLKQRYSEKKKKKRFIKAHNIQRATIYLFDHNHVQATATKAIQLLQDLWSR